MSNIELREELKRMVVSKYLSYQDAPLSHEDKQAAFEYTERSGRSLKEVSTRHYANVFSEAVHHRSLAPFSE